MQNIDFVKGELLQGEVYLTDTQIVNRVKSFNNTNNTSINRGGSIWIIGNEMDRDYQGNSTPTEFAEAYHRAYTIIKATDPTAQVAPGAVVQYTPVREQYLDQFVQTYNNLYYVQTHANFR